MTFSRKSISKELEVPGPGHQRHTPPVNPLLSLYSFQASSLAFKSSTDLPSMKEQLLISQKVVPPSSKGIFGALASIPIALFFKVGPKGWLANSPVEEFFPTLPFLDQMGLTAILSMIVIAIVSIKENKISDDKKAIKLD